MSENWDPPTPQSHTIEEQFILRVPLDVAKSIRKKLRNKDATAISFVMKNERYGIFYCGDKEYKLTLVDLPCYMESHKTIDKRIYYKSADVGQMLLVEDSGPPSKNAPFIMPSTWCLDSGITPPARHIRERKWWRLPKYSPVEIARVMEDVTCVCKKQDVQEHIELIQITQEDIDALSKLSETPKAGAETEHPASSSLTPSTTPTPRAALPAKSSLSQTKSFSPYTPSSSPAPAAQKAAAHQSSPSSMLIHKGGLRFSIKLNPSNADAAHASPLTANPVSSAEAAPPLPSSETQSPLPPERAQPPATPSPEPSPTSPSSESTTKSPTETLQEPLPTPVPKGDFSRPSAPPSLDAPHPAQIASPLTRSPPPPRPPSPPLIDASSDYPQPSNHAADVESSNEYQALLSSRQKLVTEVTNLEKRKEELIRRKSHESNRIMRKRTEDEIKKIQDSIENNNAQIQVLTSQMKKLLE
ncbi:uncharacterized protein LOC126320397 [Schistocerca gregaria]|uniref:uncharacterized protein LOC126320397 n=1 Tax=Schistocerca gregaria TaxID=7010 RepID=UPI00211DF609|nr:uncharacterized protein LOC126320397 [Schistocerca gregaria]